MFTARTRAMHGLPAEAPTMAYGTLTRQFAEVTSGRVAYLRHGRGPALLLVHGIPTSCRLWEPLLGALGEHYDCIVPDLLGLGRSAPTDAADLSSPGQARMLDELLSALGVDTVNAVFHDQGGAHGQQFLKRHGQRLRAVLFTDCVCFDNWPVPVISLTMALAQAGLVMPLARIGVLQQVLVRYSLPRTIMRGRFPQPLVDDWFYALNNGGETLRHWMRYVTAQSPCWTLDAVDALAGWQKPAHVLWATDDQYLPCAWGVKLAQTLPRAAVELLPFAGHFWQAEVPRSGADAIHRFFSGVEAVAASRSGTNG